MSNAEQLTERLKKLQSMMCDERIASVLESVDYDPAIDLLNECIRLSEAKEPKAPIEVGDILVPLAESIACQFPKGERFIVTEVDGEKFHVSQFDANTHGYWWKENANDQQFAHWKNPKA